MPSIEKSSLLGNLQQCYKLKDFLKARKIPFEEKVSGNHTTIVIKTNNMFSAKSLNEA